LNGLKKGRAGTMTHDYKRHGTTTLFAALDVLDGTVIGRCMQRHRHRRPGQDHRPRQPRARSFSLGALESIHQHSRWTRSSKSLATTSNSFANPLSS
jgi:hypothetical protein